MRYYTITTFNREFPDNDACLEFLFNARWPDGVTCTACDRVTNHYRISSRKGYSCSGCGTYVFPTAGTIFHKSSTPLLLWFHAMFLMASTRCGISAKQLQREIGVTYKTAWRMFHQIRKLMDEDSGPLTGEVEADETYIGGKRTGPRGRGADGKTATFGLVERQGRVKAEVVPDVKARTLMPIIWKNLPAHQGTPVYTDELGSYNLLTKLGYQHGRVNHSQKEFVRGKAHTNTIEGFWSLLKRGINGVYHSVSPQHLSAYLNEYAFRYNHRSSVIPIFVLLLVRAAHVQLVERRA